MASNLCFIIRFSLALFFLVNTRGSFGQVMLKTNILYPTLAKGASVALEVATPNHSSLNIYTAFGYNGDLVLSDEYKFQNLIVEKRFYKKSTTIFRGAYWAPYAKYMHRQIYKEGLHGSIITTRGRDSDGHSLGLGTALGLQLPNRFIKRTFIDAFLGGGYLVYLKETDAKNPDQSRFGHVDLRAGVSIGYLF